MLPKNIEFSFQTRKGVAAKGIPRNWGLFVSWYEDKRLQEFAVSTLRQLCPTTSQIGCVVRPGGHPLRHDKYGFAARCRFLWNSVRPTQRRIPELGRPRPGLPGNHRNRRP